MRANVDILTLTATPIPRTLNMAMSGMRIRQLLPPHPLAVYPLKHLSANMMIRLLERLSCVKHYVAGKCTIFI